MIMYQKVMLHGINNFLIVARLAEEKYYSIKNAIDLYYEYEKISEHPEELSLTIVGDGNVRDKLEEYVKSLNFQSKVFFAGATNNVSEFIEKSDIVVAIGRCVLEAIAMKRLAIISGVNDLKAIVIPENIDDAIDTNFTGRLQERDDGSIIPEMKSVEPKELAISLRDMDISSIKNIVDNNYKVIFEKLNIENNSYFIDSKVESTYEDFIIKVLKIIKSDKENLKKKDELCNNYAIENENLQKIIENQNEKIAKLTDELNGKKLENEQILNSKRWKYASKIADIPSRIKGKKN